MEEASRRRISAAKNDIQNPYRNSDLITIRGEESWIAVDQRMYLLQYSLVFSKLIGTVRYINDNITHVNMRRSTAAYKSIAVCNHVMKSGKYSAEFHLTEVGDGGFSIGLIDASIHNWPKKKMRGSDFSSWCTALRRKLGDEHITMYGNCIGCCKGDIIRMELVVKEGDFTIHKNNNLLFTEVRNNLVISNHCWAVFEHGTCGVRIQQNNAEHNV